ncbi:hypothetical protein B0H65DRAFT_589032 [Neurospora tetraspora]|uniref:Uncharacterized protein n=1 Tax=Neurospora tetraspora TaxID=94610 RepID=A0AAE0JFY9_9PEZI|nr:hypothetical protein B0H65DRAFT_589032 [Neurospora tetraspora]
MARNSFSPYAPRRRSNRMVLIWVTLFFSIIIFMWWVQTRHRDVFARGPRMEGDNRRRFGGNGNGNAGSGRILEDEFVTNQPAIASPPKDPF